MRDPALYNASRTTMARKRPSKPEGRDRQALGVRFLRRSRLCVPETARSRLKFGTAGPAIPCSREVLPPHGAKAPIETQGKGRQALGVRFLRRSRLGVPETARSRLKFGAAGPAIPCCYPLFTTGAPHHQRDGAQINCGPDGIALRAGSLPVGPRAGG